MRDILIIHSKADRDVDIIGACLRKMGANVQIFGQNVMLGKGNITVGVSNDDQFINLAGQHIDRSPNLTFWNRRHFGNLAKVEDGNEDDHIEAEGNALSTMTGLRLSLDETFTVNPVAATNRLSNKIKQLQIASSIGFNIPKTIFSNNLNDIKSFASSVPNYCVKPLVAYRQKVGPEDSTGEKQFLLR